MTSTLKILALAILMSATSIAQARFFLKVELVFKKGIDQSLTLSNELHSIEPFRSGQALDLTMKNGVRLVLEPEFKPIRSDLIGPADVISVAGAIYGADGKPLRQIAKSDLELTLGERKTLSYETDGGQLIEVTVTPGIE